MNRDHATTLAIAERAAEWLVRLPTADAQERQQFMSWLRESPVHVCEFLLAVRCAERVRFLDRQHQMAVDLSVGAVGNITNLRAPIPQMTAAREALPRRRVMLTVAAIVAVVALIPLTIVGVRALSGRSISTAAGEWQTVELQDGSKLRVGPRTEIAIHFTRTKRSLRFAHGEILIQVVKDPARPLFVESDLAVVRAVGTAFAVRKVDPELTSITVKEGVVAVSSRQRAGSAANSEPITLRAGQQVEVSALPLSVRSVNLHKELAWAEGLLIFDTEQVSDAVREFNLRNELQLKVLDQHLARRAMRGIFAADDPMSFTRALEARGISIASVNDGTLLLLSESSGAARVRQAN
jgi:transmembrane sensor